MSADDVLAHLRDALGAQRAPCRVVLTDEPLPSGGPPREDGRLRDSAMFSITAEEWPQCRTLLEEKVARTRDRSDEPRPVG
ncbi:hypothetical protein ACIOML_15195 [Streptomyces anulatus]